jgi:hypothetical protein
MTTSEEERARAVAKILFALRSPLLMISKLDRQDVYELAAKHQITAQDLLDLVHAQAKKA